VVVAVVEMPVRDVDEVLKILEELNLGTLRESSKVARLIDLRRKIDMRDPLAAGRLDKLTKCHQARVAFAEPLADRIRPDDFLDEIIGRQIDLFPGSRRVSDFRKKSPVGLIAPRNGHGNPPMTTNAWRLSTLYEALCSTRSMIVKDRLADQHRSDWLTAYTFSGPGSVFHRAGQIRRIYEDSAPLISSAMKPSARVFLAEVVGIVKRAVEKSGGHFEVPKAA
jgi:hypothetical protein